MVMSSDSSRTPGASSCRPPLYRRTDRVGIDRRARRAGDLDTEVPKPQYPTPSRSQGPKRPGEDLAVSGAGVVRRPADLITGCLFAVVGVTFVVLAQDYEFGTARRMGPGYFPTLLGGLLAALGLVLMVASLAGMRQRMERIAFGPLALVTVAIVAFGLLVRNAGLVPAIVTLVLVASCASERFRWSSAAALAATLAAFSWATFSWALGLPLPAFAPWVTAWLGD